MISVSKELLQSKQDPEDPRLSEFVNIEIQNMDAHGLFDLWGYPDDEGIKLNGGHAGASEGPDGIRKWLYKMTPQMHWPRESLFQDHGNFSHSQNLEQRHERARLRVSELLKNPARFLVSLGGGHDYGFPDAAGFLDASLEKSEKPAQKPNQKPLVINFDAHLDVRPLEKGFTSGTPFRRLLNEFKGRFDFVEVGIQPQCNSPFHLEWAKAKGAQIISLNEIDSQGLLNCLQKTLTPDVERPLFISLDIDAMTGSEAPGCSASWPQGLQFTELKSSISWLFKNFNLRSLGIYEVSPPLDPRGQTSKLAALIVYNLLDLLISKNTEPKKG